MIQQSAQIKNQLMKSFSTCKATVMQSDRQNRDTWPITEHRQMIEVWGGNGGGGKETGAHVQTHTQRHVKHTQNIVLANRGVRRFGRGYGESYP